MCRHLSTYTLIASCGCSIAPKNKEMVVDRNPRRGTIKPIGSINCDSLGYNGIAIGKENRGSNQETIDFFLLFFLHGEE